MTTNIELPNNQEAEKTTLGSVLLRPDAIHEISDILEPGMFYQDRHAIIYAAMQACAAARIPPDIRLVMNELRKRQQLESIGGLEYLSSLTDSVPTSQRVAYYAKIVVDTAGFRKLITAGGKIAAIGYNESNGDLNLAQAAAEKQLLNAVQLRVEEGLQPVSATIESMYGDYEKNETSAIPSGFRDYDEITGGFHSDDLVILAARPSVGKTSMALCLGFNVAAISVRVQVFSMEMSRKQNIQRLISMGTGIPLERYRDRKLTEDDTRASFTFMGDVINKMPLLIDDTPALDIRTLRSRALRSAMKDGAPGLIIVDYLQLATDKSHKDRFQEVSSISRQLKQLAREMKCTVLALSQLSRAVEGRQSKVPLLSDLRESGQIEQDADIVAFIHREELFDKETDKKGIAELHISKHRNGRIGVIPLSFNSELTKFSDLSYRSMDGY